jgi:hypothetical protein
MLRSVGRLNDFFSFQRPVVPRPARRPYRFVLAFARSAISRVSRPTAGCSGRFRMVMRHDAPRGESPRLRVSKLNATDGRFEIRLVV